VIFDIPRMRGTAHVEAGSPVEGWDLEDCSPSRRSS
jgi:hypothetical protein